MFASLNRGKGRSAANIDLSAGKQNLVKNPAPDHSAGNEERDDNRLLRFKYFQDFPLEPPAICSTIEKVREGKFDFDGNLNPPPADETFLGRNERCIFCC